PIENTTRRTASMFLWSTQSKGQHPAETSADVLSHLLEFAFRPVVVWEHPVDAAGGRVSSGTLALRIAMGDKTWDEGILFPYQTCEVPRLLMADLAGLEQMRRFAQDYGVGIVFAGATMLSDDLHVLSEVWPNYVHRQHPYPPRKIKQ